ncbi:MAG: hypothetical protein HDT48_00410 [Ruminococcaceae bacterium]|nr:hypothetical protein [Oscillospiraceae bacterium]
MAVVSAVAVSAEDVPINLYGEPEFIPDAGLAMDTPMLYLGRSATLPFAEYPDGSYYSEDKTECSCHSWCKYHSTCNCKKFDGSSQCMAFASYVYSETHNKKMRSAQPVTEKKMSFDYTNKDDVTKALRTLGGKPTGTYIRVQTSDGFDHSIAIVGTTATTITIYHSNYGGRCLVKYETYTWENFIKAFPYLDHYVV